MSVSRLVHGCPLRAIAVALSIAICATCLVLGTTGCDQLNRPMGHPSSGTSSSSSGSTSTTGVDGGVLDPEGGASPAPSFTAQPGDIQI